MRKFLQLLALFVVLTAAGTWAATGGNRGWTKTNVPVNTLDPVTGIVAIGYRGQFLPGVDFLGAAAGAAGLLAGVSFFFRKTKINQPPINN